MCIKDTLWCVYVFFMVFFFKYTATTEIYTYGHTLSLHDALPISLRASASALLLGRVGEAHLHLCFDGKESPSSFHVFDIGLHHSWSGIDSPHEDTGQIGRAHV